MTAHTPTTASEASYIETSPGRWEVRLGHESRVITMPVPGKYIAWIGHQSPHWCLSSAVRACIEDIEYRLFLAAEEQRKHDEQIASLMQMTPAQRDRAIARLEAERDLLDYADSEMDVPSRKARIDRQIAGLRGV
jgi:hypothetical protein